MFYRIADVTISSTIELLSFKDFVCDGGEADISLAVTDEIPGEGSEVTSGTVVQRKIEGGWYFFLRGDDRRGLFARRDYTDLQLRGFGDSAAGSSAESLVRMAIECCLVKRGFVSLHASCIELDGEAYAFSAPSGTGKSTRAGAWQEAFGAEMISGDRPLVDVKNMEVYGVPWDGKEGCYRNVHFPLKVIFDIRRSETTYLRKMSFSQKRKLLMRQCFIPMWDTETAANQMVNISLLASNAEILRAFSGYRAEDAVKLHDEYEKVEFREEAKDMKAAEGYSLNDIDGELILMPHNRSAGKKKPAVLLNVVTAFWWEKLQDPMCREDLLTAVLNEFDVSEEKASADLDKYMVKLYKLGVIEDD